MNPYEPTNLDGPRGPSAWLIFIFGFPLVLVIALYFLLG